MAPSIQVTMIPFNNIPCPRYLTNGVVVLIEDKGKVHRATVVQAAGDGGWLACKEAWQDKERLISIDDMRDYEAFLKLR